MITYRVWHREETLERLVGASTSIDEALRILDVHSGPQEFAYITLTWSSPTSRTRTYFLVNSLDGNLTTKDYRSAVRKLLRRPKWYYNGVKSATS